MAAAFTAVTVLSSASVTAGAESGTYAAEVYRQLVTEKDNVADFKAPDNISGYDVLAEVVKIDDKDNLYDGAMLRNRGNWIMMKTDSGYKLIAENAYEIDEADRITTEIADRIREIAGDGATDRELFYEYLRYMAKNFHYSRKISRDTQYMNKNGVITDTENFTDTYYTDRGLNCVGYSAITYLVANKLGAECELIDGGDHLYNAVKFSDSDRYLTFDLTLQNKYAGLGPLGNMIIKARLSFEDEKQKKLNNACNEGKEYSPAGIGEFIRELKYYYENKAEQ